MRIVCFRAENVHGYMNFNFEVLPQLNFLIGINGTGKTTVLRLIQSMLAPNLPQLAGIEHESAEITVENGGNIYKIITKNIKGKLSISCDAIGQSVEVPEMPPILADTAGEYNASVVDFYRRIRIQNSENKVFKLIEALPTPMFLGLERRGLSIAPPSPRRGVGLKKHAFAGNLTESLEESVGLVSNMYREVNSKENEAKVRLRNSLILGAFSFAEVSPVFSNAEFPSAKQRHDIKRKKSYIIETLESIGVPKSDISQTVGPFFSNLEAIINDLPDKVPAMRDKRSLDIEFVTKSIKWDLNKWQYDRVISLSEAIDDYTKSVAKFNEPFSKFLEVVNPFFMDSGKRIVIDNFGMRVKIGELERELYQLSSGEQQLLVLLTHLSFNPYAKRANMLIIDEPEISLHLAWQERFVDALIQANPGMQIILATHSPSIILDREEMCIDISNSGSV